MSTDMRGQKVVLLLGAGATVADAGTTSESRKPPLDKGFFRASSRARQARPEVGRVSSYMLDTYDVDITKAPHDSFEGVMAQIYTDVSDPALENRAIGAFRTLISLFNRRLAECTNNLTPTRGRAIYRLLCHYLARGVLPDDLSVVTFNQDLQIEKALWLLSQTQRWKQKGDVWLFPGCYRLPIEAKDVTSPTAAEQGAVFAQTGFDPRGIALLKLHGSLNWYSTHRSSQASVRAMFKPDRHIYITSRRRILVSMRLRSTRRRLYTLPVVVPPVTHKTSVLHTSVRPLWGSASECLSGVDEVTVVGYSCPDLDFESRNLIRRCLANRTSRFRFNLVEPSSDVLKRYADLIRPRECRYYPNHKEFLASQS